MGKQMNVEQWVELFQEMGMDEAQRMEWHRRFEAKYPEAHQNFLEWLNLPAAQIERIRSKSR